MNEAFERLYKKSSKKTAVAAKTADLFESPTAWAQVCQWPWGVVGVWWSSSVVAVGSLRAQADVCGEASTCRLMRALNRNPNSELEQALVNETVLRDLNMTIRAIDYYEGKILFTPGDGIYWADQNFNAVRCADITDIEEIAVCARSVSS